MVSVPPRGIPLAAHIISSFYGDLCCKVCECLLRKGTLTLALIIRYTELSKENVINCLRVLIHQNCVQAFVIPQEGAFGKHAPEVTNYMALFDNIIHKSRAPKFMQIVLDELGEDCKELFYVLIQHGRLSFDQIIDREKQKTGSFDVEAFRDRFKKLLSARFVERCPAPAPFLAPPSEDEKPPPKKRGAKSVRIAEQTMEQRALAAAAPMESIRFMMEMEDISWEKEEESTKSSKVGKKRKGDVLDFDIDALDPTKIEVLWRVNFEEFCWRLLHKACISYVKTRINNEASIVLSAILDLSGSETRLKAEKSPYLSINDIYDEVIKKDGGVGMDLERVKTSLEQLGCDTLSTDIDDESYSLDVKSIIQMAQNEEVESVVFKRYGREAYRIFRLLSKAGRYVEIDKISESTFVEKKEAGKILFKLWKDDYLEMQSFAPSTINKPPAFFLWKVHPQRYRRLFLNELYQAVLNLRLRIAHELDQRKEILQLPKDKLEGKLKDQYLVYRQVRITLERSLLELDDAILLFHHVRCKDEQVMKAAKWYRCDISSLFI